MKTSEKTFLYDVNDGVHGSFNCILYDHAPVKPLLQKRPKQDEKYIHPAYGDQHVMASIA